VRLPSARWHSRKSNRTPGRPNDRCRSGTKPCGSRSSR
jgi:hypothetical protein